MSLVGNGGGKDDLEYGDIGRIPEGGCMMPEAMGSEVVWKETASNVDGQYVCCHACVAI